MPLIFVNRSEASRGASVDSATLTGRKSGSTRHASAHAFAGFETCNNPKFMSTRSKLPSSNGRSCGSPCLNRISEKFFSQSRSPFRRNQFLWKARRIVSSRLRRSRGHRRNPKPRSCRNTGVSQQQGYELPRQRSPHGIVFFRHALPALVHEPNEVVVHF